MDHLDRFADELIKHPVTAVILEAKMGDSYP
jgi:hypothetical protein